jgi:hypothetical protein
MQAYGWLNLAGLLLQLQLAAPPCWMDNNDSSLAVSDSGSETALPALNAPSYDSRADFICLTRCTPTFNSTPVALLRAWPTLHVACDALHALFCREAWLRFRLWGWAYVGCIVGATVCLGLQRFAALLAAVAFAAACGGLVRNGWERMGWIEG